MIILVNLQAVCHLLDGRGLCDTRVGMCADKIVICDQSPVIIDKIRSVCARHFSGDGVEFCSDPGMEADILMLRASGEENFADACTKTYQKPVRIGVVLSDLQRILSPSFRSFHRFGRYGLDEISRSLSVDEAPSVNLTDRECDIVKYLIGAAGGSVSREDLLRDVWGFRDGLETHTLETHIYRLRQKIEANPNEPQFIITTESGYALSV